MKVHRMCLREQRTREESGEGGGWSGKASLGRKQLVKDLTEARSQPRAYLGKMSGQQEQRVQRPWGGCQLGVFGVQRKDSVTGEEEQCVSTETGRRGCLKLVPFLLE